MGLVFGYGCCFGFYFGFALGKRFAWLFWVWPVLRVSGFLLWVCVL